MASAGERTREKAAGKSESPLLVTPYTEGRPVAVDDFALARKPAKSKHYFATVLRVAEGKTSISKLYSTDFRSRQAVILGRLPAKTVEVIARDMGVSHRLVYAALGASRATVSRQVREHKPLDAASSERAVFLAELVKIVQEMIPEDRAQEAEFNAAEWVGRWIENPLPALDGAAPIQYFATGDGRDVVRRLLNNTFSGAYA